jgi:capsular polysaccharide transport system permease protein
MEISEVTMTANTELTFRQSFAIQRRVLHALMMRELITRYGRDNLGVLWLVGEPMIFTLGVTTLWSAAGLAHGGTGIPIVAFAVTGYSSVLMWRNATSQCSAGIAQNKPLLFHRSVHIIDVFLTRIALEIIGATSSFIALSIFFTFIGWMPVPDNLLMVLGGWLMLAWFGASLALLVGAGSAYSELVHRLWHPTAYLLFPMSGAAFMVEWLPTQLQKIVLYLPMVHGVELLRKGYFGSVVRTHYDIGYMAECCLALSLCALYVVREASRKVEF